MTTIRYCIRQLEQLGQLLFVGCLSCLSCFVCSCSESDDEDLTGEFANWQERNDAFFFTLEDSLRSNSALWTKWKSYTKNAQIV